MSSANFALQGLAGSAAEQATEPVSTVAAATDTSKAFQQTQLHHQVPKKYPTYRKLSETGGQEPVVASFRRSNKRPNEDTPVLVVSHESGSAGNQLEATTRDRNAGPAESSSDDDEDDDDEEFMFNYDQVLAKILNEKKLALSYSPEVIRFLGSSFRLQQRHLQHRSSSGL